MKQVIILLSSLTFLFGFSTFGAFTTGYADTGANSWTQTSKGLYGGDIQAIALSPSYGNDRIVYAGVSTGGVYKSNDGGITWWAMNDGWTGLMLVTALAISPTYPTDQIIFVGINMAGVFKSTNGGASWEAANNGLTDLWVQALAISPAFSTDQTLLVGTYAGIFKSTDAGAYWAAANNGITEIDVIVMDI